MTATTFGLWTEDDAVLWPERTHPPTYLSGPAFAVWDEVVRGAPGAVGGEDRDRIRAGLARRGLLDEPPDPLPAGDLLRVDEAPAGGWVLSNGQNGLPVAVAADPDGLAAVRAAAEAALTRPGVDGLTVPLAPRHHRERVVLVSPALDPAAASPFCDLIGTGPRVDGRPIAGLVLDASWVAANPDAGPLAPTWVLACLLAAVNPVATAGRYALLDVAHRLVQGRPMVWVGDPDEVDDLVDRLP